MNLKNSICFALGTRPEITKTLGIISALDSIRSLPVNMVLTGQQTALVENTFSEFSEFTGLRHHWTGNRAEKNQDPDWAKKFTCFFEEMSSHERPALIVGTGDTNSVLIAAQTAKKLSIPFLHLEAGIRHDRVSDLEPEERNRRMISPISSYHFCPSALQKKNLISEGVDGANAFVTGDLSKISVATTWKKLTRAGTWKNDPTLSAHLDFRKKLCLCTFHRSTSLANLNDLSTHIGKLVGYYPGVRFVVCARPDTRWAHFNHMLAKASNVRVIDAPAPFTFQKLLAVSNMVLTDSAGVQQEAALLNKPCVALRRDFELGAEAPLLEMVKPPFRDLFNKFAVMEKKSRVNRPTFISQVRMEGDALAKRTAKMIDGLVEARGLISG